MKILALTLALAVTLAGCAPQVRTGPVTNITMPQASEQCVAQPWLDWCKAAEASRGQR